jgi:sodium-dependent dicarboxylate transporter 2/3/5
LNETPVLDEPDFDRRRRRAGMVLGPVLLFGILAAPLPLAPPAHRMAAVLAFMVVFWVSEAVPLAVTAFLGPTIAALLGVAKAKDVLAPFADPVIFLFLGSFLLAEALHAQGLDRRLALRLLSLPGAASTPGRVRITLGIITALISMWISNTATAAMMLPVTLGLVRALQQASGGAPAAGMLLVMGIAASMGGVGTPVGTPPNLIALGFLERLGGHKIGFLGFMSIGVPLAIAMMAVTYAVVSLFVGDGRARPAAGEPASADARAYAVRERAALPPWGSGQWACATAFGLAIVLWLTPGIVTALGLQQSVLGPVAGRLEESLVALVAAGMLFFWPVGGGRRALGWEQAARIDWGTLLLFGGGLSLGKLMFDSGLADVLGRSAVAATGVQSLWGLTALALATTIVLTEIASNTATVNMLAPLVIALAQELGVSVVPPLLAVGFGSSMGFMFPMGTPPNAIVYGSGLVPLTAMMKIGVVVDLVSFFVILGMLRLLCPLLGFV